MRAFRPGPVARRIAITLIAISALMLQGLLAAPATAVPSAGSIVCAPDGSAPDTSGGDHRGNHGLCCILACVAFGAAYVASTAGIVVFPARPASRIYFAPATAFPTAPPLKFYFAARGPPQDL